MRFRTVGLLFSLLLWAVALVNPKASFGGPITGACTDIGGACLLTTENDCETGGGTYLGDGTTCPTAAEYAFSVAIDSDNKSTTGCDVAVHDANIGPTTVPGFERIVRANTDLSTVSEVVVLQCVAGTFQVLQTHPAGWNVGPGAVGFPEIIEFFASRSELGASQEMRVIFLSENIDACDSDVLLTTNGEPGGAPIIFRPENFGAPALSVGTLAIVALLLLAAGVGRLTRLRAGVAAAIVGACLLATAWALTITPDGLVGDWAGRGPAGTDLIGDMSTTDQFEDIATGFITSDSTNVYFRIDIGPLA